MSTKSDEEYLIESYKATGARHPNHLCNPDEFLSPNHPYTRSLINGNQITIDYHNGKMSQKEFWRRAEKAYKKTKLEKEKLLKSCDRK